MTDEQEPTDPTDLPPELRELLSDISKVLGEDLIGTLERAGAGIHARALPVTERPLEPLLDEAKPLLENYPEETDQEKALTGLTTRLSYIAQAKRIAMLMQLSHLAFHVKQLTQDEGAYQTIMALCAHLVEETISYTNAFVVEGVTAGTELSLRPQEVHALLSRNDNYADETKELEVMIGREMAEKSPFFHPLAGIRSDEVVRLYHDNPYTEGEES